MSYCDQIKLYEIQIKSKSQNTVVLSFIVRLDALCIRECRPALNKRDEIKK